MGARWDCTPKPNFWSTSAKTSDCFWESATSTATKRPARYSSTKTSAFISAILATSSTPSAS